MQDTLPELHHKLCKKIAQLTKVIFYLNTKNDQYQSNLRAVVGAYETQLESLIKEANIIITRYKEVADRSSKNDELETQLKKLQDSVDREKDKSVQQFQRYKKLADDNLAKVTQQANKKVRDCQTEVEGLRGRVEALGRTLDSVTGKMEQEKKAHQKAMGDLQREMADKSKEWMKKKTELEDTLNVKNGRIQDLEKLMADLKKQLDDEIRKQKLSSEALLEQLKGQAAKRVKELEERVAQLEQANKELTSVGATLKSTVSERDSTIAGLNSKLKQLQDDIASKTTVITNLNSDLNVKSKQCGDLQESNRLLQRTNTQLEATLKELEAKLHQLTKQSSLKNSQFEQMRSSYEKQLNEQRTQISSLKQQLSSLMRKCELLQLQLNGLSDATSKHSSDRLKEIQQLKENVGALQAQLEKLRKEMDELKRSHQVTLKSLEEKATNQRQQNADNMRRIQAEHQKSLASLTNEHKKMQEDMKSSHQSEMANQTAQHQKQVDILNQQIQQLLRKMEDASGYLKTSYEEKLEKLRKEKRQVEGTLAQSKQTIKSLEARIDSLQDNLKSAGKQLAQKKSTIESLNAELQTMRQERSRLHQTLLDQIQDLKAKAIAQAAEHTAQMNNLRDTHSIQTANLAKQHQSALQLQKIDYQRKIEQLCRSYETKIAQLQSQLGKLGSRSQLTNAEWLAKMKKLQDQLNARMHALTEKHVKQIQQLKQRFQSDQNKLKADHEKVVEKIKDQHQTERDQLKVKHGQEMTNQQQTMTNKHEAQLQRINSEHSSAVNKMKEEHKSRIDEAEMNLAKEKQRHQATTAKYTQLQSSFQILSNQLSQEQRQHQSTKQTVEQLQNQISLLHTTMRNKEEEHMEALKQKQKEYNMLVEEQKKQWEKQRHGLVQEQLGWAQQIKSEYGKMVDENRQRIAIMDEQYRQLKGLFDERPSREQDLQLIHRLQSLLQHREQQLRKAVHELKFFKLQLINREMNYNKMFNANPNIGVLDPRQASTKLITKEPKQSGNSTLGGGALPAVGGNTKKSIK